MISRGLGVNNNNSKLFTGVQNEKDKRHFFDYCIIYNTLYCFRFNNECFDKNFTYNYVKGR